MAHGIIHGPKHGAVHGVKHSALTLAGGIPGVTRDSTNQNYYPANASEWTAFMSAIGLATGNPSSVWNMQEASGNAADSIGSVTLTSTMVTYQSVVTGASRKGIKDVDGAANHKLVNATTAPNPALTSVMLVGYIDFPASPPGTRDVLAIQGNCDLTWLDGGAGGKLRIMAGANTTSATTASGAPRWVILQSNITASSTTLYIPEEKLVGTFVTPTSGSMTSYGGQFFLVSGATYAYGAQFVGAAAEQSASQVKIMLQGLGATVLW